MDETGETFFFFFLSRTATPHDGVGEAVGGSR